MKKYNYILLVMFAAILGFSSCEDYLDANRNNFV